MTKPVFLVRLALIAGLLFALAAAPTVADDEPEVTLRLHQFLPPVSTLPSKVLRPWAEQVEAASDGRIRIEHFDSMTLGGRPPDLFDQARDGVVDIILTLPGYTPGRFPRSEVFELPFFMRGSVATSQAYWELVDSDFQDTEFSDVHLLGAWVHGPGVIHSRQPIDKLADLQGLKIRGPTRMINDMLKSLGATPVGMPLPAIPEALSKGVIDATVVPWEVTPSIKLTELVTNHTELFDQEAFYTATFIVAMNKARYESMPDDLRAILDAESGFKLSTLAATEQLAADAPARAIAESAGNSITLLDDAETIRWKEAAAPVYKQWVDDMTQRDVDGLTLITRARDLIDKYTE